MALTYIGTGGLFTRLGQLFGLAKKVRLFQIDLVPTANTTTTGIRTTFSTFAAGSGNYPQGTALLRPIADEEAMANGVRPQLESIREAARQTVIETVNANSAVPIKTLREALIELAAQMNTDAVRIEETLFTVGATSYGGSNVGTGSVVISSECRKIIGDRVNFSTKITDFPCIRPETVRFTCIKDSKSDGIRPGSEVWHVQGQRSYDNLDRRWPGGSGHDYAQAATSADVDQGTQPGENILAHSDFDDWSANIPVQWAQVTGTAGTAFKATTTSFRGANGMEFVGDGSTLTSVRQQLRSSSGSISGIKPDTLYLISFWVRHDGIAPAGGVLRVSINDGSSILGSNMTTSVTLSGISGSYVQKTVKVMSPVSIPATTYCTVELTTALTNARSVYVDELIVTEMPRPAKGAWGAVICPGSTNWAVGDTATIAISYNGSGDMVLEMDRFLNLYEQGISFPSTAAGTPPEVLDSLIVNP